MRRSVVVALCLVFPAPLGAQEAAEKSPEKICARVASFTPGPKARPTEEDRRLVASGSLRQALVLQYGDEAKEEREYDETRRYCLVTGKCDIDLAMIFANGWGVPRDYEAATWFLCRLDASTALAEKEGMLAHVERMRTAEEPEDLRYCDHATSTMGLLYCPQPSTGEESPEDRIAKVREALSPEASRKLDELVTALDAFASADAGVWAFGSLGNVRYALREVEETSRIREEQVSNVERLSGSRAAGCTPEALKTSDAALNESYRAARAVPPESPHRDSSEHKAEWAETLRDAQRAWIKYRDAWAAFYLARWKGKADAEALKREIVNELTTGRSVQLAGINTD